jgi:hypothetical protein
MHGLASALIPAIEVMFIGAVLGSSIVILLSSVEDFVLLLENEPSAHGDRNRERH